MAKAKSSKSATQVTKSYCIIGLKDGTKHRTQYQVYFHGSYVRFVPCDLFCVDSDNGSIKVDVDKIFFIQHYTYNEHI